MMYENEIHCGYDGFMPINSIKKIRDPKVKLFRGLADSSRLSILVALRSGGLTVNEIVEKTGLSQSNVSNHLACLRCCDLVVSEQQGRYVVYQLSDARVEKFLDLADELLLDVAKGVDNCSNYDGDVQK